MIILLILLIAMLAMALWAVMARNLLKATIGLAITSAIVTMIMFKFDSPLAAVFELSVCTGLITAVFVSAISMTKPITHAESLKMTASKIRRYWPLPVIMAIAAVIMIVLKMKPDVVFGQFTTTEGVKEIMWNLRQLDMLGQIVLMLAGAFGVAILFKESGKEDE
jgi:NADH-quinone oxidoreductase subunit J